MKYQPEHFPKGTIVELDPPYPSFSKSNNVIITVSEVKNTYAGGFVLISTDISDSVGNKAYHIDHVKRIIKRGESSAVYGVSPPFKCIGKGKFISRHYLEDFFFSLTDRNSSSFYYFGILAKRFMCMHSGTNGKYSKKQLKRWFKQNQNRFTLKHDVTIANDNFILNFTAQEDDSFYNHVVKLFQALEKAEGKQVDIRKVILSVDDIAKYKKYGVEFKTFAFEKGVLFTVLTRFILRYSRSYVRSSILR